MFSYGLDKKHEVALNLGPGDTDAQMVGNMRMVLAISMLLALFVDPSGFRGVEGFTWVIFSCYALHSLVLYIFSQTNKPFSRSKLTHWLDILWYALIVLFTGRVNSFFLLLFFFAILTSSFRWGFEEGARVTVASVVLFAGCGLAWRENQDLPRLLLRTTFMFAFGYMCAYWGETKAGLKRRLVLLRNVSRLSNPRFGVDHTIKSVLEQTKAFFNASSCILVMRDKEFDTYTLRTIKDGSSRRSVAAEPVSEQTALPFMVFSQHQIVAYTLRRSSSLPLLERSVTYDGANARWIKQDRQASEHLAEILEVRSFISAPLSLRRTEGRIYVLSRKKAFSRGDALFLNHIAAQAFPVIDSIELLDRMASEAARQERKRIALNLHDTAIQPYIGLKMGLGAVRRKAAADNPLIGELDKLAAMTARVIEDLRDYAGTVEAGVAQTEPILLVMLQRQVAQIKEFYGIDIVIHTEGALDISDRLTTEVLHIVREGLNNICKHTVAQRGFVKLQCICGRINIHIENEGVVAQLRPFIPRSIAERAHALGGNADVRLGPGGNTAVHVDIPI